MDEKTRLRLLGELIHLLQNGRRPGDNFNHVYAHFYTKRGRLVADCQTAAEALDCLWNDVHKFEEFDLAEADRLELHVH